MDTDLNSCMIQRHVDLTEANSLRLSSSAAAKITIKSIDDLHTAFQFHRREKLPLRPLGDGSNVILSSFINACILDIAIKGIEVVHEDDDNVWVKVGAGENWHEWVSYTLSNNWFGLENLALIPGRVGASPIQNIGAYGVEVASYIDSVQFIDLHPSINHLDTVKNYNNEQCQFSYRNSIFKEKNNHRLIVAVTFRLAKSFKAQLNYPALSHALDKLQLSSLKADDIFSSVVNLRNSKLPDPYKIPNAGSFFKNIEVGSSTLNRLLTKYSSMPYFSLPSADDKPLFKIPSAWLIEYCGYKGRREGCLAMHAKQALVLINLAKVKNGESVSEADVLKFSTGIVHSVYQEFGLSLEIEPQKINE
ncbi:MAG: UDP-N-acetylenolpyruvoylglucosamine reductase [Cellvibrionales bacterium]|nr:UDP-N-acetylenolpyruvoylglucosamine reductase [Cellvibrionales bacterium]|tara:strand:+ start:3126 stop:4211 length:1086 start_codon:yes stop_codon:yes gene_type:complete